MAQQQMNKADIMTKARTGYENEDSQNDLALTPISYRLNSAFTKAQSEATNAQSTK